MFTYEALNQVVKNARTAIEDELPGNNSNASLTLGITGFDESSVIVLGDCCFDKAASLAFPRMVAGVTLHANEFAQAV